MCLSAAQEVFISISGIKQRVLSPSSFCDWGWGLLLSLSVPFCLKGKPTHLYFDSYRQGVQLFVQLLEHDQLFQGEAAQPVEEKIGKDDK